MRKMDDRCALFRMCLAICEGNYSLHVVLKRGGSGTQSVAESMFKSYLSSQRACMK